MKENILFVMKEVAICLGFVAISLGLNAFLFKEYLTEEIIVDSARTDAYSSVEREKYIVINADIQDEQNPTQKYETSNVQLETDASELRYMQGTTNPFVSSDSSSDLPSDMISAPTQDSAPVNNTTSVNNTETVEE